MKSLNLYISEKLVINKDYKDIYIYICSNIVGRVKKNNRK